MAKQRQVMQCITLVAITALAAAAVAKASPETPDPGFSKLAAAVGAAATNAATAAAAADAAAAEQFRAAVAADNGPDETSSSATIASLGVPKTYIPAAVTNVTAFDGSREAMDPRWRLKLAQELKGYLENKFGDRPDALDRINKAWQTEQRELFKGDGWGYNAPESPSVEAMSSAPGSEAINALYEAGHPAFQSSMEELVLGRGYPLERHTAVTPDGYELVIYRIPYGKNRNNVPGVKKPVVYLQHGVTLASDSMVILNENESLGFVLADAGFDVWMGNTRGNTYSRRNVNGIYPYQLEFWYFSIDELATLDIPTMLDYILKTTGASKLAYTGHSQGCTLAYMLCADKPEWNEKFSVIIHMGPVVFVDFFRAPFLRFAATNSLDQLLILIGGTIGIGEFLPNRLVAPLYVTLCSHYPLDEVCAAALSFIFYGPSIFITPDDYVSIATTWPSSVGIRNLEHWAQWFRSPELQMRKFDFGTACNLTKWKLGHGFQPKPFHETCNQYVYGSEIPPIYDMTKVTAPNVMFLGDNDIMSVATDVEEEVRRLGNAHVGDFIYSDYGHMDFVWDRNSKHSVDMVDVFYRFSPGTF